MLTKPKITILSVLIIIMLAAVPLITASDSWFLDGGLFDPAWEGEEIEIFETIPYEESPYEEPIYDDITYTFLENDEFLWFNEFEDPFYFDDPMIFPGDDIQDIGDADMPPVSVSDDEPEPTIIKAKGLNIQITGTRMPGSIDAGDQLVLRVYVKNNGKEHIDNMEITLINQELALRDNVGPMDLRRGKSASKVLLLDFPHEIQPGYYYLRINIHANGLNRVIYRDICVR